MILICLLFLFFYCVIYIYTIYKISTGKIEYIIVYIVSCLPVYITIQALALKFFDYEFIITSIKLSKDIVFFYAFLVFLYGTKVSFLQRSFCFSKVDKLMLIFSIIVTVYAFIPLGEASLFSKLIYAKNLYIIFITYIIGRNITIDERFFNILKRILNYVIIFASIFLFFEFIFSVHFHSLIDFSNYNLIINDIYPQGNYGLSWSFESQGSYPRYAAFFSNPLELSASLLLITSFLLFDFFDNKKNIKYFLLLLVIIAFILSFSRASIVAFFLIILFALFVNKKYRVIKSLFILGCCAFPLLLFVLTEDFKYLLIDTLTFENTSSLGHLFEWIEGIITISENPFGIGLAMSGNASGVDQSIKVGGENQFLIFGVQMGIFSVIIYLLILYQIIKRNSTLYLRSSGFNKQIYFIVSCTKFGLLLPLLTSNAELYLFVSLSVWFLAGYTEKKYTEILIEKN